MNRLLLGIFLAVLVSQSAPPAFSQIALLFPYGVAAGDVTPTSAILWGVLTRQLEVTAEVSTDSGFARIGTSAATAGPAAGGSVKVAVTGLRPATRYYYRLRTGRGAYSDAGTFVTAPPDDTGADLRLAFTGDADGTHVAGTPVFSFEVLNALAAERPDVFVFLGDTIYGDSPHAPRPAVTLEEYRAKHFENRSIPALRRALAATSVIAMWDDHEVENDFDPETVSPAKLAAGRQAFLEAYPITNQPRGRLYRSFRWGRDVEIFVLDSRSGRSRQADKLGVCDNPPGSRILDLAPTMPAPVRAAFAPLLRQMSLPVPAGCLGAINDPNRTLLGWPQKLWLKRGLQRSPATWKFPPGAASPGPGPVVRRDRPSVIRDG